jgi:uncharacterized membrane protein YsdA (DUF1294 family)
MRYLLGWFALASLLALAVYAWDKRRARRGGRRVPEATLLWLAFLGGAAGAQLAMHWRRHKTKHLRFRILVPLFLLLHIAAVVWLAAGG